MICWVKLGLCLKLSECLKSVEISDLFVVCGIWIVVVLRRKFEVGEGGQSLSTSAGYSSALGC